MALLDRVALVEKALLPLVIMGAAFALTSGVGVYELSRNTSAYRQILAHSMPAVLRITQLSQLASEIGYSIDRNLVYVCGGKDAVDCERTAQDFQSARQGGEQALDEAIRFDPIHRGDYDRFRQEFRAVVEPTARAMALGMRDQNEPAKAIMAPVNNRILALRDEVDDYARQRAAQNRIQGLALARKAQDTQVAMIVACAIEAAIALSLAAWIAIAEMAAPLKLLARRMEQLADGDLDIWVPGQERRDEIGAMARALQVFKENARAKAKAEEDARRAREAAVEAQRRAREEVARVARVLSVGELASSIAHEISQPIGAIVANNQASMRWLDRSPPDVGRAMAGIERALRDGQRAGAVIQRVRSMISRTDPEFAPVDLNALVREVLDFTADERSRADVIVRLELDEDLPRVQGDQVQLQQVLLNLVMNGVDALRDQGGGRPSLAVLSTVDGEQGVVLAVEDNGAGFDAGEAERLFEPFFTTKAGGVGLGLPISRSIIETHGGKIWAEPAQPRGARFAFRLPAMAEMASNRPAGADRAVG